MNYFVSKEKKDQDLVLKHLRNHNFKFTGVVEAQKSYIYILDGDKLVAGAHVHVSWNWASFKELMYLNVESLALIIKLVLEKYNSEIEAISYYTRDINRKNDLIQAGFEETGRVTDEYCLAARKSNFVSSDYNTIVVDQPHTTFHKILESFDQQYKEQQGLNEKKEELTLVCYDKDEFAGGVYSLISKKSMYIDLLVVNEAYRLRGIGRNLMLEMEKVARSKALESITLGTAEFQARAFYEKLGYKVVYTQKNQPKGYECYSLVKELGGDINE